MTRTELARELGMAQPSLSDVINGKTKPSVRTVLALAMFAGERPSALAPELLTTTLGPAPARFPSKVGAAWAALECEIPAEAIRRMWLDEPSFLDRDPGPRWWYHRAEMFASGIDDGASGGSRGSDRPARQRGKRSPAH